MVRTGTNSTRQRGFKKGSHKKGRRATDLDQVYEEAVKHVNAGMPKNKLDDGLPGLGQFYCTACSRYFIGKSAQDGHVRTKAHKRRLKELRKPAAPYGVSIVEQYGGEQVDNGEKIGPR